MSLSFPFLATSSTVSSHLPLFVTTFDYILANRLFSFTRMSVSFLETGSTSVLFTLESPEPSTVPAALKVCSASEWVDGETLHLLIFVGTDFFLQQIWAKISTLPISRGR